MKSNNIFLIFICFIIWNDVKSQPGTNVKELYRDRPKFQGSRYGHPYTTFDMANGQSFDTIIHRIRLRIKSESPNNIKGPIFEAYQKIYANALSPQPNDSGLLTYNFEGKPEGPSGLALWAKNNAFVMLVGLDEKGDTLSLLQKDSCKNRVITAFNNPRNPRKNLLKLTSYFLLHSSLIDIYQFVAN